MKWEKIQKMPERRDIHDDISIITVDLKQLI